MIQDTVRQSAHASTSAGGIPVSAVFIRRLANACETRLPMACQSLANEQSLLGRILYKNKLQHRRHAHLTRLAGTFKSVDALLDTCDLQALQRLARDMLPQESVAGSLMLLKSAAAEELRRLLEGVIGKAAELRCRAQASFAAFAPMIARGVFVPFALGASAVLGRVFALASEVFEAATAANSVLEVAAPSAVARQEVKELAARLPSNETQQFIAMSKLATAFVSSSGMERDDEDLGEPIGDPPQTDVADDHVRGQQFIATSKLATEIVSSSGMELDDEDLGEPVGDLPQNDVADNHVRGLFGGLASVGVLPADEQGRVGLVGESDQAGLNAALEDEEELGRVVTDRSGASVCTEQDEDNAAPAGDLAQVDAATEDDCMGEPIEVQSTACHSGLQFTIVGQSSRTYLHRTRRFVGRPLQRLRRQTVAGKTERHRRRMQMK